MFNFKRFSLSDERCAMKIGTDGVLLGAWAAPLSSGEEHFTAIDIGAGSGLITLMLAQRFEKAHITALEIDPDACADAASNIAASPFAGRATVINDDFTHFASTSTARFDLIASNPPFFTNGQLAPDNARATARHQSALNYQSLIEFASRALRPDGVLAMVTPAEFEDRITASAELARLKVRKLCRVVTRDGRSHSRLLWQVSPTDGPQQISDLAIRNSDNTFSDEYRALTRDFYLNF